MRNMVPTLLYHINVWHIGEGFHCVKVGFCYLKLEDFWEIWNMAEKI